MANLYLALIHYPVVNKRGQTVGSAVTNMDIHDIARASATFGVKGYYIVTPYEDQAELTEQIMAHWITGAGGVVNPSRKEALEKVTVAPSLEAVCLDIGQKIEQDMGRDPNRTGPEAVVKIGTSARAGQGAVDCGTLRTKLEGNAPHLLIFGTAWGLTEELIDSCDMILEPIRGAGDYNHLSVRSAASIYLDRLTNGG